MLDDVTSGGTAVDLRGGRPRYTDGRLQPFGATEAREQSPHLRLDGY